MLFGALSLIHTKKAALPDDMPLVIEIANEEAKINVFHRCAH
jgi:PII-like signaling protein